jgi:hypothetical protein
MLRVIHIRNRGATSAIPNGLANPSKTNDLTGLLCYPFSAGMQSVCNSPLQSGNLFRRPLELISPMPLARTGLCHRGG